MSVKYFWLLSDGKTVREIGFKKFQKLGFANMKDDDRKYLIVAMAKNWINCSNGRQYVYVPLRQLNEVLFSQESGTIESAK